MQWAIQTQEEKALIQLRSSLRKLLMRKYFAILMALFAIQVHASDEAYIGTWFSCDSKSGEYEVLDVEKLNDRYVGLLESSKSGGVYSAQLSGAPIKAGLILTGCQSYRGEACTNKAPTIRISLKNSNSAGFIHIPKSSLKKLIKQCSENSQNNNDH
ncbi:hypothetical protein [Methyloradius palustris]|uniref:Uncharacterized protein n=1 Tax=Methyloradius palustris TaxID=2778876 RepID=A0A8D5JWR8_9PROT|nr:hypothetical protein [Methyloradius palustris]BCM25379.1 hypothetical protein ZMTM_16380 [Methyloradius palustris]